MDERLSELIGLIYEASLQPQLWTDVLEQVTRVTPSLTAALHSHDTVARVPTFHQSFGNDPAYVQEYIDKWAATNPLVDVMARLEPGVVSTIASDLDYEVFRRTPFFTDWARPQGFCDAINVMLERTPTRVSSVSLITSEAQGRATPGMIRRTEILAPHFLRAVRIGRVLEHATIKEDTLVETLNALASAVFLFSGRGDLVHGNAKALDLLARGMTVIQLKTAANAIAAPGRDAGAGGHEGVFAVQTAWGERFVGHRLPIRLGARRGPGPSEMTLVVVQNATSADAASKSAATLFGLTARERDVLFGLVEVGGITPVAAVLGLSKQTVKSHVKTLFQKTQTNRQSDLVRLVGELMTPFAEPR